MSHGSSSAPVSVDTDALNTFASNISQLAPQVAALAGQLPGIDVNPGGFTEATSLATLLNGGTSFTGALGTALNALEQALNDLATAAGQMSGNYQGTEGNNSSTAGGALKAFDSDVASMTSAL